MFLDNYKYQIFTLCKTNNVETLFVFGSVLTPHFNQDSDVDFLVEIKEDDPLKYADNYFNLKFGLEDLLNKPIDLLEAKTLKNPFLKQNIDNTKITFYEQSNRSLA